MTCQMKAALTNVMLPIESVIDDDRACIEKLIDNREAKKNNGYIMPQKPAGTGNYHKFNQDIRLKSSVQKSDVCAKITSMRTIQCTSH